MVPPKSGCRELILLVWIVVIRRSSNLRQAMKVAEVFREVVYYVDGKVNGYRRLADSDILKSPARVVRLMDSEFCTQH